MPKSKVFKDRMGGDIQFNVVPLIDVIVVLIMFLILTSRITSSSFADLLLPSPQMDDPNMAKEVESNQLDIPNRILVNVLLKEASDPARIGDVKEYRIGAKKVEKDDLNMEFKKQRDIARAAKCTELFVDIRADRSIKYEHIAPVLMAAALVDSADVKVKLNIAALRPTARPVEFGR